MPIELSQQHLDYMNLGARYRDASLGGLTMMQRRWLKRYLDCFGEMLRNGVGVYLFGANSVGKTYMAAVLCKEAWARYRVSSYMVTSPELKEGWIADHVVAEDGETFCQRINSVRVLAIDDLGKEHRAASGYAETQLGGLLRRRARKRLTTIITANLTPKEFGEVYGRSTAELAKECLHAVQCGGESLREMFRNRLNERLGG